MTLYHTTQLCGDSPTISFRRVSINASGSLVLCTIEGRLTIEAKHIRALAAALDAYEAQKSAEVAA